MGGGCRDIDENCELRIAIRVGRELAVGIHTPGGNQVAGHSFAKEWLVINYHFFFDL